MAVLARLRMFQEQWCCSLLVSLTHAIVLLAVTKQQLLEQSVVLSTTHLQLKVRPLCRFHIESV